MHVDFNKNKNIISACDKIKKVCAFNIDMAVLPEMFCCPYSGKYFKEHGEEEGGPAQEALSTAQRLGTTANLCNSLCLATSTT